MSEVIGLEAKLYYDASGMSETPTWTELTNVKDVTLNLEKADADVTTRASGGWRLRRGTLKDARVEWEMQWDTEDTGFTAIQSAWQNGTNIALAIMDGDITTTGTQGLQGDFQILSFTQEQPLEGALTVRVSATPAYNTQYPPEWVTISGA